MNVLIIDDDRVIANYFQRLSTKIGGVKVFVAHDPESIDKILRSSEFDCILCDIHLAGTSTGPDVLISNKNLISGAKIHLISCADDIQDHADKLARHGFNIGVCVRKPLDPRAFVNFLKENCK